ncbi:MAG: type IV pilus secretin PilQ [Bacteriovoracaceae bacterium]
MMKIGLPLLLLLFSFSVFSAEMSAIRFQQFGEVSRLEFALDSNGVEAVKFKNSEVKQIVIDLKNVKATDRVRRGFDTSEFPGSIVYVSAYPKASNSNDLRVAIQLRDNVRSILKRGSNKLILDVENRFGVFTQAQLQEESQTESDDVYVSSSDQINIPKSEQVEDILENLTLSGKKKYIGKKITINVQDMKVEDILKLIADASGFNIIITDEIKRLPPLTLNLTSVPWDQSLDTILSLNKLVAKKNGIILMVTTLDKARKDKELEIKAKKVAFEEEPLVTRVFAISYAKTADLIKILKDYSTEKRGRLTEDTRINALIVKDTAEVIEKMRKIIETLDTQTPQVLIEAKIVEVSEEYSKEIGLQNGLEVGYDPVTSTSSTTDAGPGFSFSSAPSAGDGGRSLFGLSIERFNRLVNLNFSLQLMESESKGKIIASPKVITQNKQPATLSTSDETSYVITTTTDGNVTQGYEKSTASLSLNVTPQVTNEGSISLDIALDKQQFGTRSSNDAPPNKQGRSVKTTVLVENGSTIVLGGIYNFEKRENHSGIPFLKDIPLIGWLFRTAYNPSTAKNEMVIFITPRIINQEEAGLSDRS